MSILLRTAIRAKGGIIQGAFDRATRDPGAVQTGLLMEILKENRHTQYGRQHSFEQIASFDTYAGAVPINAFSDLSPHIDRMKRGERNILTKTQPVLFNLTSGTTAEPKYVPITPRGLAMTARTTLQWVYRALQDHPAIFDHSFACITGSAVEGYTESGIPYGSASGMMYENLPRILQHSFALPFILSNIKDYDLRYYVMTRLALEKDVSFLVTPNPTTLIRLAQTGIKHQEKIIRSIRDGQLNCEWFTDLSAEDRQIIDRIRRDLKPNPQRARSLERVIKEREQLLPFACWESLKLIGCWLGGSVGYQADKLAEYYGKNAPMRDIGYLASEASISVPYRDGTPAGILALQNNFYEFIPAENDAAACPKPLLSHELDAGQQYRIILTSRNGLYRYDIHDIIEVHGFYNRAPVIAFVRKCGDMLNITGEKLHVNHLTEAFRQLEKLHHLAVTRFRVVPNYDLVRHEILIHCGSTVAREYLESTVLPLLDKCLAECNVEYESKRKSRRLNPPCIHVMDDAWPGAARPTSINSGGRDIQYKWKTVAPGLSTEDAQHILYTVTM